MYSCRKCGYKHEKRKCPAYRKKCNNCQRSNHFAKMCKRQKIRAVGKNYESLDTDSEYYQYFIQSVECTSNKEKDWKIVVVICET